MSRCLPAIAACLLALTTTGEAGAARQRRQDTSRKASIAVFPLINEGVARASLEAAERHLVTSLGRAGLESIAGSALEQRLQAASEASPRRCGRDAACFTKLGKRLRVDEVLFAVLEPGAAGSELTLNRVDVASGATRRAVLSFPDQRALEAQLAGKLEELFGEPSPPSQGTASAVSEGLTAVPLVPLGSSTDTEPGLELVPLEPVGDESAGGHGSATQQPGRASPTGMSDPAVTVSPGSWLDGLQLTWIGYTGASMTLVGVAATTYGYLQYREHTSVAKAANESEMTSFAAAQDDARVNTLWQRSQLVGWGIGLPLLSLGAGLLVWDLFDPLAVEATVTPHPGGASARLQWRW